MTCMQMYRYRMNDSNGAYGGIFFSGLSLPIGMVVLVWMGVLFLLCQPIWSRRQLSSAEQAIQRQGMVDVETLGAGIRVSLMYGRADNFTGKVLYSDITRAYLHPKAAEALVKAQHILKKSHPRWSLVVYDAARPMSVQQKMWNEVKNTPQSIYVSNPARGGGLHNYGMAVDISICDEHGDTITMGTKIDYMGTASHIDREEQLVKLGRLTREQVRHRQLLRQVMQAAGFRTLRTEWWHFNFMSRATARKYYQVIK